MKFFCLVYCYHLPTKLQEGNVFTRVCVCQVIIIHDVLDPIVQAPALIPPDMGFTEQEPFPSPAPPLHPRHRTPLPLLVTSGAITGDMFKLVHFRTPSPN